MKDILDIETEQLTKIESAECRRFAEYFVPELIDFYDDYKLNRGVISRLSRPTNRLYINALFRVVDLLYQYYEISQRHFELLDLAARNLRQLCDVQISEISLADRKQRQEVVGEIREYLDRVALIFQAATDRTEQRERREVYQLKAREYSKAADFYDESARHRGYYEKLLALYERTATEYSKNPFLLAIFSARADEYRAKYIAERSADRISFSPAPADTEDETPDTQPLLDVGLRRRRLIPFWRSKENPAVPSNLSTTTEDKSLKPGF